MIANKVVVLTGASSGIGEALARLLGNDGARMVLGARRAGALARVAAEIDPQGRRVVAIPTDVTDRRQAENLVAAAVEKFGRIDVLINNAGRGHMASVEDTSDEVIEHMFAVNVFALWYTTRPALRVMKAQGSGHIITVASMAGKVGFPFNSAYVAAKHAAAGFTYALRTELIGTPLVASVVFPAGVDTPWARVTEGSPMLPLFSQSGPIVKRIVAERGISLPAIEGVISPERVAESIRQCILRPVPEVFTHQGSKEFAELAARDRENAEILQAPIVEGEREVYDRVRTNTPQQGS